MAGYNGWSNYETWLTSMYFLDDVETLLEGAVFTSKYELGQFIKERTEEYVDLLFEDRKQHAYVSDMLQAAFSSVNWYELADHIVRDMDSSELADYGYTTDD